MTKRFYGLFTAFLMALLLLAAAAESAAQAKKAPAKGAEMAAPQHTFTPDGIKWGPAPPFVEPGAQLAVVEGDPMAESGTYTIRLKMPAGYRIAPHWHPKRENVTVISGSFKVGMGDKFDESKMKSFPAGSFAYLDPDMHHYAMAGPGESIVQVHGLSPVKFNYVNPADDPSKKAPPAKR